MGIKEFTAREELEIIRAQMEKPARLRRQSEKLVFQLINLLVMPLAMVIYVTINAEGLRAFMPFFGMPVYRLPIPGFGALREYDGWNRLDLGHITALGLLILLSWIWAWVVEHLTNSGNAEFERSYRPTLFYIWSVVVTTLISIEAAVFYAGLVNYGGGLWSDTSRAIALSLTVLYVLVMLCIAKWHNNFKYGV